MSEDYQTTAISELAGQIRTHLEFLQELGIESAREYAALASAPKSAHARSTSDVQVASAPPPVRQSPMPRTEPKTPATAGLADLPRLGAPRNAARIANSVPTTRPEPNQEMPLAKKPLIEMFTDNPISGTLPESSETLLSIHESIGACVRCSLHEGRTHIVHTEGNPNARLMFVGEAPGADEDAQARPFVGRAGQLLGKIIEAIGFRRDEVLIGNINRCRPPGNRPPMPDEVAACKPFLLREIGAVRPEVVVVLGNTAMKNLLGVKEGITKLRGTFQDFHGIKVMPTFHPAYLLRDPSKKRETWADLKKVRDFLLQKPV
ncbi:MAG: uracil-DNA glycosylase family protein [Pyrinomonadaceae bacterium]